MQYLVLSLAMWVCLSGSSSAVVAEEGSSESSELMQERPGITDADKQETAASQMQLSRDGRLTPQQLRAVIRARRDRLRVEMKARRESLRTEGAAIQQEIMAKRARVHLYHKEAAEVIVQPANQ